MVLFYFTCFVMLGLTQSADSVDHVQLALDPAQIPIRENSHQNGHLMQGLKHADRHTVSHAKHHRHKPHTQSASDTCVVTLSEHWDASINSAFTGFVKTLTTIGKNPLADYKHGVSSVKVQGKGCAAYGYTNENCEGDEGKAIWASSKVLGQVEPGLVGPSTALKAHWGCNDCLRCVRIAKRICQCPGGTPAVGEACPAEESTLCTACDAGHFLSDGNCSACTTCSAGSKIKTKCTKNADAICQCSRGYAGSAANSCTPCAGQQYQDELGQATCKTCKDGKEGYTEEGSGTGNSLCKNTFCQRPAAPANSHVVVAKCPSDGKHGDTCTLKCNAGYTKFSATDFTCAAVSKSEHSAYEGGKIVCKAFTCSCVNGDPATGPACSSDGAAICTTCHEGYFLSNGQCSKCKACAANSETKTKCTENTDTICQCSRGYVGTGESCTPCSDTNQYQDEVGQSLCKTCPNGEKGVTDGEESKGNTQCKNTLCQRPAAPLNSYIDAANCPSNGTHGAKCALRCNEGYTVVNSTDFTCGAAGPKTKGAGGDIKSAYQGGNIDCKAYKCKCAHGVAPNFPKCTSNGANVCSKCDEGYYLSNDECSACKSCAAGSEMETKCSKDTDTICQCARGYVGTGESCTPCIDANQYQDEAGQSSCKTCPDGQNGVTEGDGTVHTQCKSTKCQRPAAPTNSYIDTANCPAHGKHGDSCALICNDGYVTMSSVDFTCKAVEGETQSSYQGGSIDCQAITPAPTPQPTPSPTYTPSTNNYCTGAYMNDGSNLVWLKTPSGDWPTSYLECMNMAITGGYPFLQWSNPACGGISTWNWLNGPKTSDPSYGNQLCSVGCRPYKYTIAAQIWNSGVTSINDCWSLAYNNGPFTHFSYSASNQACASMGASQYLPGIQAQQKEGDWVICGGVPYCCPLDR